MIIVDSSVVIAILNEEPEAASFEAALEAADTLGMSAFNGFETKVVIHRRHPPRYLVDFALLIREAPIDVHPFDAIQADLTSSAYRRFGKGTGHPARLKLGDCAAYALATSLDVPLLFKGDDFTHTDVRSALG